MQLRKENDMNSNNELTREDIAIDRDMDVDCDIGQEITAYIETWFDVDEKFGTDTSDDDVWLNMYINRLNRSISIMNRLSRNRSLSRK